MITISLVFAYDSDWDWKKVNEKQTCKKDIGSDEFEFLENTYPKNKEHIFDMCEEHAANTCCTIYDINRIIARLNYMKS